MTKYRNSLPQLSGKFFLTDGGLETTLVFHDGMDLPFFAAFDLLTTVEGRARLESYYRQYAGIAVTNRTGFILEAPTWRASRDWAVKMGYSTEALKAVNEDAIALLLSLQAEFDGDETPMVVSGNIGPRGDGYSVDSQMTAAEAQTYHAEQINAMAGGGADMICAMTMTHIGEAQGVVLAAKQAGAPVVISFTLETDGNLPSGESLEAAIAETDAISGGYPAYYMINCAHPTHFAHILWDGGAWTDRLMGLRCNASKRSHAELDEAEDLDDGNPQELGAEHKELQQLLPHLTVFGGCCGTDHRHVGAIHSHCAP